jgi:CDP-glycerol glycerophosphotransferase
VVANTHLPRWFTPSSGQTVLQTWHGTALKRIGIHAHSANSLRLDASSWTLLVSPSPFMTPIMAEAYLHDARIIETGYPRNDVLARNDPRDREAVRNRLGISQNRFAIALNFEAT